MPADEHAARVPDGRASSRPEGFAARVTRELRGGSKAALADVYDRFAETLVRDVRRHTGRDEAFALDCLQETVVRLATNPPLCTTDEELRAWLRVTAIRVARTALLAEARRSRREGAYAAERQRGTEVEGTGHVRRSDDADAELRRALSQLDDHERDLLRLRVLHGWSIPAIAQWIAMEPRRLESRVRRLFERLRERGSAS